MKHATQRTHPKNRWLHSLVLVIFSFIAAASTFQPQASNPVWSKAIDITNGAGRNQRTPGVMACDAYQNLHIFFADQAEEGAAIFYRNDASGTLSFPNDVVRVQDPRVYNLRVAISPHDDTVHLTWVNLAANGVMYYSTAPLYRAGDATAWTKPIVMAASVNNSDVAVDPDGGLHLVYSVARDEGISGEVFHQVSTDSGMNWSDPELVFSRTFTEPSFVMPWMDIDQKGRIHLAISMRSYDYGVASEVGYIRTLDDGATWSEYRMVQETGTEWQGVAYIDVYAFGEDEIHITWHDPRRMHIYSMDGGNTWSQPDEIIVMGAAFGGPNELAMDSSGTLHVVTAISYGVYHSTWENQRWGAASMVDNQDNDPHGQNLVVCQGNQLHVVYWDRIGELTVWYSTRQVNAPHLERKPIPQPENVSLNQPVNDENPTGLLPTPTSNNIRETLAAEVPPTPGTTRMTLTKLLSGVVPSLLLIVVVIILVVAKVRR